MHTGDFLKHCGQESLWVIEASQPEGLWASCVALSQPVVELIVAIKKSFNPSSERRSQPRDLNTCWIKLPLSRHSEIVKLVNGVNKFLRHDDCSVDSLNNVVEHASHDVENLLELLNLLAKENVEWDVLGRIKTSWAHGSCKSFFILDLHEVRW